MKFEEATKIIKIGEKRTPLSRIKRDKKGKGFMVHFEIRSSGCLHSNYFPDKHANEELIRNEVEAWELAERFAQTTPAIYVNIYVIDDTFKPVANYKEKTIRKYY